MLISFRLCHLLLIVFLLSGCAVRPFVVNQTADALSGQGMSDEDDLQLAREASAFYLKASESVLRETPGHLKLAQAVSAGYTQYAYAFVAFDADKIDAKDPAAAAQMRERAARLYARAHRHAMTALERNQPGFAQALAQNDSKKTPSANTSGSALGLLGCRFFGWKNFDVQRRPRCGGRLACVATLGRMGVADSPLIWPRCIGQFDGHLESRPGGWVIQKGRAVF